MKTLLFDNNTGKVISPIFENGYLVDGKHQSVDPPIYELEYKPTTRPAHDSTLQVVSAVWIPDTVLKTYTQQWSVRDKTDEERAAEINSQAMQKEQELNPAEIKSALQLTIAGLPEAEQVNYVSIYTAWKVGEAVNDALTSPNGKADIRQYNGVLYKAIQPHTTQLDWTPDLVPALWVQVNAPDVIPVWKQPTGTHDAYQTGDKVHFPTASDPIYRSLIDANVWSPTDYPDGWKKL
jgi:hypothetical protein